MMEFVLDRSAPCENGWLMGCIRWHLSFTQISSSMQDPFSYGAVTEHWIIVGISFRLCLKNKVYIGGCHEIIRRKHEA
jgi:hypothetical protein